MPGTTSFSHDQHHETDAAKRKRGDKADLKWRSLDPVFRIRAFGDFWCEIFTGQMPKRIIQPTVSKCWRNQLDYIRINLV